MLYTDNTEKSSVFNWYTHLFHYLAQTQPDAHAIIHEQHEMSSDSVINNFWAS